MVDELIKRAKEWHLELNELSGVPRFRGTRIPLERVVFLFQQGFNADQIHSRLDSLSLESIYGAIFFTLQNQELMDAYMREVGKEEAEVRSKIDSAPSQALKEKLLARQAQSA